MLPLLYNVPRSESDWNIWSASHAASHQKIIQKIRATKGVSLTQYQLDPMNFLDFTGFLNRNQQAHNDMLNILGIPGADLQALDPKNQNQLSAWIFLHAKETHDVETALGI